MMEEVEAGRVEAIVIKDMSRLGRDYLKVGQVMEILRQRGVRLIAINDGVDSARGDDDFTPFRNIMNEYYARDTSRKIRSTFQSIGKSGKHLTGTVIYGYLWNENRTQWLVDPEAAEVVKRIFAMTIDGFGPYQIAKKLSEEKILIPSAYLAQFGEGVNKNKTFKSWLVDDWLMGIFKNRPFVLRHIMAFLVLKMLACFEIDRMPQILTLLKNTANGRRSPAIYIFEGLVFVHTLSKLCKVSRWYQDFFL